MLATGYRFSLKLSVGHFYNLSFLLVWHSEEFFSSHGAELTGGEREWFNAC